MIFFQGLLMFLYVVCILESVSLIVTVLYHELSPRDLKEFR
jgi:hypothetical protein